MKKIKSNRKELSLKQREQLLGALKARLGKNLNRQELDVANKTRRNLFGWRGQFTPELAVLIPSNSRELETRPIEP